MTTIHVVTASQGEYSDRTEWNVKAFRDAEKAKTFCDKISAVARDTFARLNTYQRRPEWLDEPAEVTDAEEARIVAPFIELGGAVPDLMFGTTPTYHVSALELEE